MEDSLLNLHFHLYDVSFQVQIHLCLSLFNQFLNVKLLENILQSLFVWYLEMT